MRLMESPDSHLNKSERFSMNKFSKTITLFCVILGLLVGGCIQTPDNQRKKQEAAATAKAIAKELGFTEADFVAENFYGHDFTKARYVLVITTTMDIASFNSHVMATGKASTTGGGGDASGLVGDLGLERIKVNQRPMQLEDEIKLIHAGGRCWVYTLTVPGSNEICLYEFKPLPDTYTIDDKITIRSNIISLRIGFELVPTRIPEDQASPVPRS